MEREPGDGLREELDGPDASGASTNVTGAGGESARDDDPGRRTSASATTDPLESKRVVIAPAPSTGSPGAVIAPEPDADVKDPLGSDDDESDLQRRTR